MIRSVTLAEFNHIPGISTRCFTYNSQNKTFSTEISILSAINSDEFIINGKLCRSNGHITLNDRNRYGSLVLKSSKTGVRAFFTFESEQNDAEGHLQYLVYRYFAADNDIHGLSPIMRQCKIYAFND